MFGALNFTAGGSHQNSCKHSRRNPTPRGYLIAQGNLALFTLVVLQKHGKGAQCHHEQTADWPFLQAAAAGNNYDKVSAIVMISVSRC